MLSCGGFAPALSEQSQVDQRLEEAFAAVREVSESHGDVSRLVQLLNQALTELEAGADPDLVVTHLDSVLLLAAEEKTRSLAARDASLMVAGAQIAVAAALAYAAWTRLPRLFWRRWLRVKGGWLVEHADR